MVIETLTAEDILSVGATVLGIAPFVAAFFTYDLFVSHRRGMAAVAGLAGGSLAGVVLGGGFPVAAGGVGGAVLGFLLAQVHPRGGTVAIAMGTGLTLGILGGLAAGTPPVPSELLPIGLWVGAGLVAVGWRFPRFVILPGLGACIGGAFLASGWVWAGVEQTWAAGPVVTDTPLAVEGAPFLLLVPLMLLAQAGATQPFAAELSHRVPPILPGWVRWLLGAEDARTGVPEEVKPPCPECGAIRDPGHDACPSCGASTNASYQLDAAAVDHPCPICEERPIEELATTRYMIGYGVGAKFPSERLIGCHRCLRDRLLKDAGRSALLGWWWLGGALNPGFVIWQVARALTNRGPTRKLVAILEEQGIEVELLDDSDDFDPDEHLGSMVYIE